MVGERPVIKEGTIKACIICGKEFESLKGKKYCSPKCRKRGAYILEQKRKEEKLGHKKDNDVSRIAREARNAGMSYGAYVAMKERRMG